MPLWRMRLADKHKPRPVHTAERESFHGRRARRLANLQLLHVRPPRQHPSPLAAGLRRRPSLSEPTRSRDRRGRLQRGRRCLVHAAAAQPLVLGLLRLHARPGAAGVVSERAEDIGHTCMCNIADTKGVTNHYRPVTAKCGPVFLCHNSAPLERRAVSYEEMETPVMLPPSSSTAVMPLISMTTEATPGSLPTAIPGPTSAPTSD
jgi:hypothetical protein